MNCKDKINVEWTLNILLLSKYLYIEVILKSVLKYIINMTYFHLTYQNKIKLNTEYVNFHFYIKFTFLFSLGAVHKCPFPHKLSYFTIPPPPSICLVMFKNKYLYFLFVPYKHVFQYFSQKGRKLFKREILYKFFYTFPQNEVI